MGAPPVPPLCRETQSLRQQMLNAPVGINGLKINVIDIVLIMFACNYLNIWTFMHERRAGCMPRNYLNIRTFMHERRAGCMPRNYNANYANVIMQMLVWICVHNTPVLYPECAGVTLCTQRFFSEPIHKSNEFGLTLPFFPIFFIQNQSEKM